MDSNLYRGSDGATRNPWSTGDLRHPPRLLDFETAPRYDLATVVHVLGVRQTTLLAWEQQLGIPALARHADAADVLRRYSERDLVALVWIRDRVLEGLPASEAIALLVRAQQGMPPGHPEAAQAVGVAPSDAQNPPLYRPRINTQPLRNSAFGGAPPDRRPAPPAGGPAMELPREGAESFISLPSGPLTLADLPDTVRIRRVPGPAGADLRRLAHPLLRAFGDLDTAAAHAIVSEALAATSLEAVCVGLLQPALNRIGELWAHRQITMPEERFALNYIRAFLFSHFHATAERPSAPMVFVGCGPREYNDLGALMLATFCRHAGLRTIYLGQDVDAQHLVQESRTRRLALIALTITTAQRVRALSRLARELQQGPAPQPIFAFGGPIFARNPELQRRVSGIYLGDDITTATWHLRRLLGLNRQTETQG
ncbi:MAG TPA: cobalamin B12-binding domain-containing protein [Ktedonobacterales bacterium]